MFLKKWFFPFFFLTTLFAQNIFFSYLSLRNISVESGMLQRLFIPISLIAYVIFARDLSRSHDKSLVKVLCISALILVLYYLTSFFYSGTPSHYISNLLAFGSMGFACIIVSAHFAKYPCYSKVDTLLPFFVIPIALICGTVGLEAAARAEIVKDDTGMGYQTLSYMMAEIYASCVYYVFFASIKGSTIHKIMKYPMMALMLFCVAICLLTGGRGAFVFIVFVTLFLLYMLKKTQVLSTGFLIFIIIAGIAAVLFIGDYFSIWDSVGFQRIANQLTEDDERNQIFDIALRAFNDSVIFGHGIGSIWWEVGIYSHNMFLDLLVETGVLGTIFISIILLKTVKKFAKICQYNYSNLLIGVIFLKAFVMGIFSSYWIGNYNFWIALGFVMVYWHNNKDNIINTQI